MHRQTSRWSWAPSVGLVAYTILTVALIYTGFGGPQVTWVVSTWNPLPAQIIVLALLYPLVREMQPGLRRLGWRLIACSVVTETLGNVLWAYLDVPTPGLAENCADVLFLMTSAFGLAGVIAFFFDVGGSFRFWRVWLDGTVLAIALGISSWLFLFPPHTVAGINGLNHIALAGYVVLDGLIMIMLALLVIQITDWRRERPLLMLIFAQTIAVLSDVGWLAARARGQFDLDTWVTVGGYTFVCAMFAAGMQFERRRLARLPAAATAPADGNLPVFMPMLGILLALAALLGEEANPHGLKGAVLVGIVIACATLAFARQLGVRYQIRTLYRTLAAKEAESRLTELVRRSSDLITVVNQDLKLVYVSPASEAILGLPPASLQNTPASAMLGADNEQRLATFLDEIAKQHLANAEIEAVISTPAAGVRTIFIAGSDQLANPAIAGITLTLRDVTEQRRLEREVLEISAREQQRMSTDIHEGLGQELTGISLLLKSAENEARSDPDALQAFLKEIVGHVNQTIDTARNLATGLAPLQVARGSLDVALANLVAETRERFMLKVTLRIDLKGAELDTAEADHFYRIAREAINNAARHSNCRRIDVDLHTEECRFVMTIADDGVGIAPMAANASGLGLRMIAYRARVMGGAMQLADSETGGARISISAPISSSIASSIARRSGAGDLRRGKITIN